MRAVSGTSTANAENVRPKPAPKSHKLHHSTKDSNGLSGNKFIPMSSAHNIKSMKTKLLIVPSIKQRTKTESTGLTCLYANKALLAATAPKERSMFSRKRKKPNRPAITHGTKSTPPIILPPEITDLIPTRILIIAKGSNIIQNHANRSDVVRPIISRKYSAYQTLRVTCHGVRVEITIIA